MECTALDLALRPIPNGPTSQCGSSGSTRAATDDGSTFRIAPCMDRLTAAGPKSSKLEHLPEAGEVVGPCNRWTIGPRRVYSIQAAPFEKLRVAGDNHPMRTAFAGVGVIARDEQNGPPPEMLRQASGDRFQI